MSYWDWGDYKPKPRIKAKGGIKSQSKRGSFGESWWAKRWIATLESFNIGARLSRGRSYARSGQVLSIDIAKGEIKSKVQGSSPTPYKITIKLKQLDAKDWQKLTTALASQAIFAAKLMAGEMPQDIEQAFKDNKLSLFPEKLRDLETDCSCPDWSNPCKHIAAVYYLLGEEFDRDPFLLFKLRGLSREELIEALGQAGAEQKPEQEERLPVSKPAPPLAEPLPTETAEFWKGKELPPDFFGEVQIAPVPAALPRRLGKFPFWRGTEHFLEAIEPIYKEAARRGLNVFLGESGDG